MPAPTRRRDEVRGRHAPNRTQDICICDARCPARLYSPAPDRAECIATFDGSGFLPVETLCQRRGSNHTDLGLHATEYNDIHP